MMRFVAAGFVAFLSVVLVMTENHAGEKAKYTIAEVMAKAHKSKLFAKVAKGDASDDEKKTLVELYTALNKNTPPAGDEKKFKQITGDMLKAAKAAAEGDEKGGKLLLKLVNCGGCHKMFKSE